MKNALKINVLIVIFAIISTQLFAQNEALKILENGNVGINTNTPSQKLEVNGNIVTETAFLGTGAHGKVYAAFGYKGLGNNGKDYSLLQSNVGLTFLNAAKDQSIRFRLNNEDKMIMDASGNFGIGTITPFEKLHIQNGSLTIRSKNTLYGALKLGTSNKTYINSWAGLESYNTGGLDQADLRFYTSYGARKERLRITQEGKVGIGIGNPNSKLHIESEISDPGTVGSCALRIESSNSDAGSIQFGVNKGYSWIQSHGGRPLTINQYNNVGIGTSTPTQAKLVISGGSKNSIESYAYLVNKANKVGRANSNNISYSIYATNRIACNEFNAFSDARIKNIIGISDSAKDLEILSKIEITNYKLTDTIKNGNKINKKVIAQQVKKVYPQAVDDKVTEVIPNIYEISTINNGWITLKEQKLKTGDRIKLIFADEDVIANVLEVKENAIKVDRNNTGQVFVYGKEVHDFHTVDYEAISMLNVSATQALLKRIEQLESDKKELAEKQNETEEKLTTTISRIEKLEKLLINVE